MGLLDNLFYYIIIKLIDLISYNLPVVHIKRGVCLLINYSGILRNKLKPIQGIIAQFCTHN